MNKLTRNVWWFFVVASWFFGTELLIALIISSVGVLLVGLPCHIVLQARGLYSWWRYALAGFVAPALLVIVFLLFVEDKWGVVRLALGTGGFGALVGSVFWGIAVFPQARASRLTSSCSGRSGIKCQGTGGGAPPLNCGVSHHPIGDVLP